MNEHRFLGKLFTFDDESPPPIEQGKAELAEIERTGAEVTRIHHSGSEAPLKYFIQFPAGRPQVETRMALEKLGYDVGQKLQPAELAFYVTKRRTKTKGWEV